MIQATGAMARGLEVEQTGPDAVATAQCGGPGTDFWFVGPGQHAVAGIELYLMNTDNQPATAEVDVYTDSGPLLGSTDTGIAVPAHGIIVQSLAKLVRNSRVLALHISTSVGRVVAAVRESPSRAKPGAWLPAAQPPSTSLVLPGLPGSPGTRQLYVIVPGAANAQVKLTAVTPKGSYQPTGGTGIDLPGGSAVSVALPSLGGQPAAVRLTSNVPVTATMSVPGRGRRRAGRVHGRLGPGPAAGRDLRQCGRHRFAGAVRAARRGPDPGGHPERPGHVGGHGGTGRGGPYGHDQDPRAAGSTGRRASP